MCMAAFDQNGKSFPCARPQWPSRFSQPSVEAVARKLKRVFDQNACVEYLSCTEIQDYSYYEALLIQGLDGINRRITEGSMWPFDLTEYPKIIRSHDGVVRACIYIGSFDPFQLTHLTVAVRYLASNLCRSDFLIVVPEGSNDSAKPLKTEYGFRLSIAKMQCEGIFDPFIKVLDLGMQADTIEIVRRFIAMHRGLTLELTHLIGSDVLPIAARYISEDMRRWTEEAHDSGVRYIHRVHVVQRGELGDTPALMKAFQEESVPVVIDPNIVATPSSTDFRSRRAFTIVLPTPAIRDKMEVIFRYHMHKSWTSYQE